jgi:transglutaminase-like putative cysteine protease
LKVGYIIARRERGVSYARATGGAAPSGYARWLRDDALVKVDDRVRKIAADVTKDAPTNLEKARAIYAYVLSTMKYQKTGEGWGKGSIVWACDMKYGNCTDFHALLIGLLRATGIPARFQIGYSVPAAEKGDLHGYHCWADFYLDGVGWVPVDASEAWKHPEQRDYFFGHHDDNRFALSTGRDITFPGMRGPALNYFVYPYAEAGGAPASDRVTRKTTFVSQ